MARSLSFGTDGVALVLALGCATVAEEVLGASEHPTGLARLALQTLDHRGPHHLGESGVSPKPS